MLHSPLKRAKFAMLCPGRSTGAPRGLYHVIARCCSMKTCGHVLMAWPRFGTRTLTGSYRRTSGRRRSGLAQASGGLSVSASSSRAPTFSALPGILASLHLPSSTFLGLLPWIFFSLDPPQISSSPPAVAASRFHPDPVGVRSSWTLMRPESARVQATLHLATLNSAMGDRLTEV